VELTASGRAELDTLRKQSRRLLREALRDRPAAELRRIQSASDALALLTEWTLEKERSLDGPPRRAQSTSAAASSRKTRRALRS